MTRIDQIRYSDAGVEYVWGDSPTPTDWEKEAIQEYRVTDPSEIDDALAWREAVDAASTVEDIRMVERGKDPRDGTEIPRP